MQSQLSEMGFERDGIIALLEQQEKKGNPLVDVDQALNLMVKQSYGYEHDFAENSLPVLLHMSGRQNALCMICGENRGEHANERNDRRDSYDY